MIQPYDQPSTSTAPNTTTPTSQPGVVKKGGVLTSEDGPFYDIRELSETAEDARQKAFAEAREQGRKSHVSYGRA